MSVASKLRRELGPELVLDDVDQIQRVLKDNSWLSPVLAGELARRMASDGPTLGVEAVLAPRTTTELAAAVRAAVALRVPITPRGSGTSNFGLVAPSKGGVVLDVRQLKSTVAIGDDRATAATGTLQGAVEQAARAQGRELPALTTTYATATVGGWIAGGHVGLGSSVHGSVWDEQVHSTRVVVVDESATAIDLDAAESTPLLHTFGTIGLVEQVTFRTVPAVDYVELVGLFPDFATAAGFTHDVSIDPSFRHRVVTAQEPDLVPAFRPLRDLFTPGCSIVLMIADQDQRAAFETVAAAHRGRLVEWQPWTIGASGKPSLAAMVYGHRMLWVKKLFPDAAFLHLYLDPDEPMADVDALRSRSADRLLFEMKYIRSGWMRALLGHPPEGTLPAAVVGIDAGGDSAAITRVMAHCDDAGIRYQNPHTSVIEDSGMFPDVSALVAAKQRFDPHGLLNPGKLRAAEARR